MMPALLTNTSTSSGSRIAATASASRTSTAWTVTLSRPRSWSRRSSGSASACTHRAEPNQLADDCPTDASEAPVTTAVRGCHRISQVFAQSQGVVDRGVDVAAGHGIADAEQLVAVAEDRLWPPAQQR
jgi:hypothetical protein